MRREVAGAGAYMDPLWTLGCGRAGNQPSLRVSSQSHKDVEACQCSMFLVGVCFEISDLRSCVPAFRRHIYGHYLLYNPPIVGT